MAQYWVGGGGLSLADAAAAARPGDVIQVAEGDHAAEHVTLTGVQVVGVGDPKRTVLRAQLDIAGQVRIANLTVVAPHFRNAMRVMSTGIRLDLEGVTVHGEPTGKYPALWCSGGTLVLNRAVVHGSRTDISVVVEESGELHAVDSGIAKARFTGSRASLRNCSAFALYCFENAVVESRGCLTILAAEGKRSMVIDGESAVDVEWLHVRLGDRAREGDPEIYCEESVLRLGRVDEPLLVFRKGRAFVDTQADAVRVLEDGEAVPAAAPKVIAWSLRDARSFSTAVAPNLKAGDTITLEEGEYFLDDYTILTLGADLVGRGSPEQTVVHGTVEVMQERTVSLSNLTIRPRTGHNGLLIRDGAQLTLTNVRIEPAPDSDLPTVYLGGGVTTMRGSVVVARPDAVSGILEVDRSARLVAADSALGWVRLFKEAEAELTDCSSHQIWAHGTTKVTGTGHLFEATTNWRGLGAEGDAVVRMERAETDDETFTVFAEGAATIAVDHLEVPDGATATVMVDEGADVALGGAPLRRLDTDGQPVQVVAEAGEQSEDAAVPRPVAPIGDGDPLARIEELTGLEKVKRQIRAFTRMVQFNQARAERGLRQETRTLHSMFLGNPGTGKTTVARLLGEALHQAGAVRTDAFVVAERKDLVGEHLGASARLTAQVLESARGGVLFIDEAYTLYQSNNNQFGAEAVDTLLAFMENNRDDIVVIFAGYTDRMQDFLGMNPGLKSRVPNRFDFEDYTPAEIGEIGYRELTRGDYTVDEELYRRMVADAYGRSSDRANGRWVRNFNEALTAAMAERVMDADDEPDFERITEADLYAVTGGDVEGRAESVDELIAQLNAMIGLDPVKDFVRRLVNRVKVDQQLREQGTSAARPTYHMVFAGNPGTGKTSVARIIARLFHNLGILEHPTVKSVERATLVGAHLGETEEKTAKAIDEAMGGVLFVDEAYQLTPDGASGNDFGKQAVETFMTRLEDDRDKFVAIFAGYTDEMDRFLGANPGLRSRIPLTIEFPDYSPQEIGRIVVSILAARWTFDEDLLARAAGRAYADLPPRERHNGRWARNFAERIEAEHTDHIATAGLTGAELLHIPDEIIARA